jgi:hypothetical protein
MKDADLWAQVIKKRNAEHERRMREDPDHYQDELNEKANAIREKNCLPRIKFSTAEEDRARAARIRERLGLLPAIEDRRGFAAAEVATLREELAFYVEKLKTRILEPPRDRKDDAYSTDEIIDQIIGISGRLGAYIIDTPKRRKLDKSRVASFAGKKSGPIEIRKLSRCGERTLSNWRLGFGARIPKSRKSILPRKSLNPPAGGG